MIKRFNTGFRKKEVVKETALLLLNILFIIVCIVGDLWMRFDFRFSSIDPIFWEPVSKCLGINVVCTAIVMFISVSIIFPRFAYRFLRIAYKNPEVIWKSKLIVTMMVGVGATRYMFVCEMKNSKILNRKIPCIINHDPKKLGTYMEEISIVGFKQTITTMAKKYNIEEIIIPIPMLKERIP